MGSASLARDYVVYAGEYEHRKVAANVLLDVTHAGVLLARAAVSLRDSLEHDDAGVASWSFLEAKETLALVMSLLGSMRGR